MCPLPEPDGNRVPPKSADERAKNDRFVADDDLVGRLGMEAAWNADPLAGSDVGPQGVDLQIHVAAENLREEALAAGKEVGMRVPGRTPAGFLTNA